jgi:hypothetical protein
MIQTIRVGHLLREAVAAPYRNLVTRPTGAAVRSRIEAALAASPPDCQTTCLDFSDIDLLDLSCADEVVAKLLLAVGGRGARFVVLQNLREDQREAIEHVLTHHRLVVAALTAGQTEPRLLGWASSDARAAFACIGKAGPMSAGQLTERLDWSETRGRQAIETLLTHRLIHLEGDLYYPLPIT